MRRFKIGAIVLVIILTLSCFAGCGEKTAKGEGEETVAITVMHYMGEQSKRETLDAMVAAFEEANPGIKVKLEQIDSSEMYQTYQTRFNSGDSPDILFGSPREMVEFVDAGLFMDLTGAEFLNNIVDEVLEETTVDGKYYAVPIDVQVKAVFYNKNMFADRKLEVPKTLDEFKAVLKAFDDGGITPLIHSYAFNWAPYHELDAILTSICATRGGGNLLWDSQNGVAPLTGNRTALDAATVWNLVASYKEDADLTTDLPTAVERFAAGDRPMFISGGWIYADTVAASSDEFGFFPIPWSNNPDENKLEVALDDAFIVSNQTQHKDEVFKFLEFVASDEAAEIWMTGTKLMSSSKNSNVANADPYVQAIKSYIDAGNIAAKANVPDYTAAYSDAQLNTMQTYIVEKLDDPALFLKMLDDEIALCNQ
jgi:ABC-type glycerol-3-phosphate transport system substrate-binding protein